MSVQAVSFHLKASPACILPQMNSIDPLNTPSTLSTMSFVISSRPARRAAQEISSHISPRTDHAGVQ